MKSGKIGRIRLDPAKHQVLYGPKGRLFRAVLCHAGKMNRTGKEAGRKRNGKDPKRAIEPFPFVIKGAEKEKISEGRSGRGRSPGKTKRPGGSQKAKKVGWASEDKKRPADLDWTYLGHPAHQLLEKAVRP